MTLGKALADASARGRVLVGLDFDGTLAPLAVHPSQARFPSRTRGLVGRVAGLARARVAMVSGRRLEDLRRLARLPRAFYAGNHGLDVAGPGVRWVHPAALRVRPELRGAAQELRRITRMSPGAWVEDKGLSLSLHFRQAPRAAWRIASRAAARALEGRLKGLRVLPGKKVWEVRPRVAWNKGDALLKIARGLGRGWTIVFAGDDLTDEEGFRTLRGRRGALTVRVGGAGPTSASFRVPGPRGVDRMLEVLWLSLR